MRVIERVDSELSTLRRVDGFPVHASNRRQPHSTAFTIDSMTFLASPNTIIVFGW